MGAGNDKQSVVEKLNRQGEESEQHELRYGIDWKLTGDKMKLKPEVDVKQDGGDVGEE